jgi:class 3 adenylate cyclase
MPGERALERRVVTVVFADLAGFTTLGDSLDPEDLRAVQDAYFAAAGETVGRHGGVLEKFIGDAVVALFGVPRARDDDAERAVRAGLALVAAVDQLGAGVGLEPGALQVRVGVNTGEVLYGEGGPDRGAATGDAVNVASRLESVAAPGSVLLGDGTALAVEAAIELAAPVELEVKGKAGGVRARRALGVRPEPSREQAMGSLRAPLLGRAQELAALRSALDSGASVRTLVVAPPGVGKTRLVEELALAAGHACVCRARFRPATRAPQATVAQLVLSGLPGHARSGPDDADAFLRERLAAAGTSPARADVVTRELLSVAWPERSTPGGREREALFAAWAEGLDALAGDRPALWVAEDVHWAGKDVLAFLEHAGGTASRGGRLVLATSRPVLLEQEPAWSGSADLLLLQPLPAVEVAELVRALVGEALPPSLVERVGDRAGGNPLFVEELLRSWISGGILVRNGNGDWWLTHAQEDVPLPTTVHAIYAAQIDDLPEAARVVTRRGSVAGRRFPAAGLPALEVADASDGIDVLLRQALLSGPLPDPLGESFAFRHALLRDAAYAGLARRERARLHVLLARWIEGAAGAHLAELAESIGSHYAAALAHAPALAAEIAEGLDREATAVLAADWFERAAEAALAGAAHETARELLRRSLELTPERLVLDRSRRWRLLGEATAAAADLDEAEQAVQAAVELARSAFRAGDPAAREAYAETVGVLGRVFHEQLRFGEELRLADETLGEIGEGEDRATARLLLLWTSGAEGTGAAVDDRRAKLDQAVDLAARCGDARLEFQARIRRTFERADLGDRAVVECAELTRLGRELGEWRDSGRVMHTQAALMIARAAYGDALAVLDDAAQLAEAHGLTELLAWNHYWRVEAGLASGDWEGAVGSGLDAVDLAEENAYHRAAVRSWFALVPIAGARDDRSLLGRARDWFVARGLSAVHASTISPFAHLMTCGVELVLSRAGLTEAPEPDTELCLGALGDEDGLPSWLAATDELLTFWLDRGDHDAVRAALERPAGGVESEGTMLGAGIFELAAARLDRDPARAQAALRCFRAFGAPWWTAKALRALESLGDAVAGAEAAGIERRLGVGIDS